MPTLKLFLKKIEQGCFDTPPPPPPLFWVSNIWMLHRVLIGNRFSKALRMFVRTSFITSNNNRHLFWIYFCCTLYLSSKTQNVRIFMQLGVCIHVFLKILHFFVKNCIKFLYFITVFLYFQPFQSYFGISIWTKRQISLSSLVKFVRNSRLYLFFLGIFWDFLKSIFC